MFEHTGSSSTATSECSAVSVIEPIHALMFSPVSVSAVVSTDVRRRSRGGERRARAEPQSGDRREAAELHLPAHLAARHQPHELPAHGKHTQTHLTHYQRRPTDISQKGIMGNVEMKGSQFTVVSAAASAALLLLLPFTEQAKGWKC